MNYWSHLLGHQLLEVQKVDKKHILQNLSLIWQDKTENEAASNKLFTQETIEHFKQIGTLHHSTFAPLLFLPHWRYIALELKGKLEKQVSTH